MNRIAISILLLGLAAGVMASEHRFERTRDIVYKEVDGRKLRLNTFVPRGDGPFPAVLVVHGGAWRAGSRTQLTMYAKSLARRGFACFSIDYRLAPRHKSPAQIEDCRDAVRWIRQHAGEYRVDPGRIGAIGYSAGGHLVSLLATTGLSKADDPKGVGTKITAAVAGGAPTDFRPTRENSRALTYWLGGRRRDKPAVYNAASPAAFVDGNDAPIFFYNGSADMLVPVKIHRTIGYAGPTALHAALKEAGVATDLHVIKGAGHFLAIINKTALESGYAFLDKHLKPSNTLRVFWLAGQSNMQGQGVVDFDHPKHYNGGRGILKNVMKTPGHADRYRHIVDANGDWIVRDDVFVRYQTKEELKTGGLSIGFTGYGGKHHIGPEFQLGHLAGEAFDEPVLLIKTAWGGKSIHKDFRPPSAGGTTGEFYTKMLAEYREALAKLGDEFPHLAKRKPVLGGFVWFQGWNDMFNDDARNDYQANLVHLINDIRKEVGQPDLPVVIGELGNDGPDVGKPMLAIRAAQKAAAEALGPYTVFVPTTQFARPAKESPNVSHGHHWYGNAESYFLIGDALGQALLKLNTK
ncbi:MAG: alpha/beta fold hydrolase [Verrucomicrobiota bacterium]|nr:alpha/beta fold hydrolase [Verrucomicrobiota bacterium]